MALYICSNKKIVIFVLRILMSENYLLITKCVFNDLRKTNNY